MKKMNINKVCDLKSISVFPPNLRRRSSVGPSEPQASQQQQYQRRSQSFSQQSFSQAPSSQRGCLSQMTQSSVDELLAANEQRFNSQERDQSLKKVNCLPPISLKRDDSHLVVSRSSSGLTRRWSSASAGESKSQISEELEQRFGVMETSLSKFGMMLDSIQSDIMQANRGTKEVFLETERIQQKLILQDISLQQLIKEQAGVKASLDGGVKSILEELKKDPNQEKLQKILVMLETAIPKQIETAVENIQREITHTFTKEIQVLAKLKMPEPRVQVPMASQVLPNSKMPEPRVQVPIAPQLKAKENLLEHQRGSAAKVLPNLKMPEPRLQVPLQPQAKAKLINFPVQHQSQRNNNAFGNNNTTVKTKQPQPPRKSSRTAKTSLLSPKTQVGSWKTVKPEQRTFKKRAASSTQQVKSEFTHTQPEQCHIIIDSDEDLNEGFSCLIDGINNGVNIGWNAEKETEKILRSARRNKRKFSNPIIIN